VAERMQNNCKSFKIRLLHAPTYGNVKNPLAVCQNKHLQIVTLATDKLYFSFVWDFSVDNLPSSIVDVLSFGHDYVPQRNKRSTVQIYTKMYYNNPL